MGPFSHKSLKEHCILFGFFGLVDSTRFHFQPWMEPTWKAFRWWLLSYFIMIITALVHLALSVWNVVKLILLLPLWWLFAVLSVCTTTTRFHPPIRKCKTHLVKSPWSLLEYLLRTKILIQLMRWGGLPLLHKSLKRYINSCHISAFCLA